MQKRNNISILASFATIKSLSDEQKYQSPYQILSEFIRHIILTDALYAFTAVEMKCLLNEHFDFAVPEAVVKSSLKHMAGISLADSVYNVAVSEIGTDSLFEQKKHEADEYNSNILLQLIEYVKARTGEEEPNESVLTQELIGFLIEDQDTQSHRYTDFISEFVIKNEHNPDIQKGLDKIREGSVLYIGISQNISEVGRLNEPLTLYLGTEVLFSLAGFNGEVFKQLANDFYDQVRLANLKAEKSVTLHYFSDVKKEMDEFFSTAEEIADGRRYDWKEKQAMKAITTGCHTSADVAVKQSDFYHLLQFGYGITQDPHTDYYDETQFSSNLESYDYIDEEDKKKKREMGLKFVSHINKLRNGKRYSYDIESEFLFVTNTRATLAISKEQSEAIKLEEKLDNVCNFAVSLDRITSLLWYKLGSGLTKTSIPASISTVLQARVVLSTSIAKHADKAFSEIKKQYEEGTITKDQVAARIITLRNKPKLPEDLQGDDIDEIMDFSPDYLSRLEEQHKGTQKKLEEREKLIEKITADANEKLSAKDEIIAHQVDTLKNKDNENAQLRNELDKYRRKDEERASKIKRRKDICLFTWSITWKLFIVIAIACAAIYFQDKFPIDILGVIVLVMDLLVAGGLAWKVCRKDFRKFFPKENK